MVIFLLTIYIPSVNKVKAIHKKEHAIKETAMCGARHMAQRLRMLATPAEDMSSAAPTPGSAQLLLTLVEKI